MAKGKGKCEVEGVVYRVWCKACEVEGVNVVMYWETERTGIKKCSDHRNDLLDIMKCSNFEEHCVLVHDC